jgi:predicted nucleic acid-binding protein
LDALADTCFFIDVQRGRENALSWLARETTVRLSLSVVTYGELAVGQPDRAVLDRSLSRMPVLPIDPDVAWIFGTLARQLRATGKLIGPNDLWIASTALSHGFPVITRNRDEFARVPGLKLLEY